MVDKLIERLRTDTRNDGATTFHFPLQELRHLAADRLEALEREKEELRRRNEELERTKLHASAWEDSARLNKDRAETAARQLAERDADLVRKDAALFSIAHTFTEDSHGGTKCLPGTEYQAMARAALAGSGDGWREITDDERPPHDTPLLLWQPPSMSHPAGLIEARPFSTGRSGKGWSEYSQHSWATHWMPLPASPPTAGER